MTDAVTDFRAEVDSSRRDTDGFESTRVLANESQLVFVTEETEQQLPLSNIFDVSQGITKGRETGDPASLTLAFRDGEVRETVTVRCDRDTLAQFQIVLFRLLFDGTDISVRTDDKASTGGFIDNVSLTVSQSKIQFQTPGGGVAIEHDSVAGFDTKRKSFEGRKEQPAVFIYWADDRYDAKTTVLFPTMRLLNLFGRYMQSYTAPAQGPTAEGAIRVLLVDDDQHDLEMATMLLQEAEPRLAIETRPNAKGALDVIASDQTVHCVVSDYDMPGTDGIELLQRVREHRPNLPFILFTGQGSEEVAKQAIISDATDYVEKGIGSQQYDILADRIRQAVG